MSRKSIAVIGLGKFGKSLAMELSNAGADVLAIDINEEPTHDIADEVTQAVCADISDVETISALGLANMDAVVISMTHNMDASILATIQCKEAGVPYVFAKAKDEIHKKILLKVGADTVIIPEQESGLRVARQLMSDNILDYVALSDDVRIVEIKIRPEWVGSSLLELNLRKNYHINVIALKRGDQTMVDLDPNEPLTDDFSMWIIAEKRYINKL